MNMSIATSEPDAQRFEENLTAFFSGGVPDRGRKDLTIGLSDEERQARDDKRLDAILAEIDELVSEDEPCVTAAFATDGSEPTYEIIRDEVCLTPYDKARSTERAADEAVEAAEEGSEEYHRAMAVLAVARAKRESEHKRGLDDGWRNRRKTDEWRQGVGREEYNASRRVRKEPNANLKAMSPEEREQHKKDQGALRGWKCSKRKAGWTKEKIEAATQGWWVKRLAKNAAKKQLVESAIL